MTIKNKIKIIGLCLLYIWTNIGFSQQNDYFIKSEYYPDGNLKSTITYKEGQVYGFYTSFYKDDMLQESGYWMNNRNIGQLLHYYPNGNIKYQYSFGSDGKRAGHQIYYHNNSIIKQITVFYDGKEEGYDIQFDSLGTPENIQYYEEGELMNNAKDTVMLAGVLSMVRSKNNLQNAKKKANETEKKNLILLKEKEKNEALQQEEQHRQNIIITAVSGGLAMVILFSVFLYNRFRITRKQKNIIEKQKEDVHHQKVLVEEKNKEILDSIRYAKRIQEAILPSLAAMQQALNDGFVLYKPKDVVAGDFYWLELHDGKVYFAAADCTGHGVPGAMVSVICSNALSIALLEEKASATGELLHKTREIVINRLAKSGEEVKDGMDISLCAIDFSGMTMQWSGANNPLWIIRNGEFIEYKHDKQAIGVQDNAKPFTAHTIELQNNDTLYIFTDGYQDQFGGPKGKKFRPSRLKEKLLSIQNQNMDDQKIALDKEFEMWKGENEQVDDVCVIGVRV